MIFIPKTIFDKINYINGLSIKQFYATVFDNYIVRSVKAISKEFPSKVDYFFQNSLKHEFPDFPTFSIINAFT